MVCLVVKNVFWEKGLGRELEVGHSRRLRGGPHQMVSSQTLHYSVPCEVLNLRPNKYIGRQN